MSKTVTISLTEKQFRLLKLCVMLGGLVKDSIEDKSRAEAIEEMELFQLLDKSAYEAKLEGSSFEEGFYSHGADIEEEMLSILGSYDEYIESGDKAKEIEAIRKQIESMR